MTIKSFRKKTGKKSWNCNVTNLNWIQNIQNNIQQIKMDILSALKSWGSQRGQNNSNNNSKSERILSSPRFSRTSLLAKSCRRRNRSQNLTICRENHVKTSSSNQNSNSLTKKSSNSLPTSRASSVFGDSYSDLPKIQSPYRQTDFLDPFQGETSFFDRF